MVLGPPQVAASARHTYTLRVEARRFPDFGKIILWDEKDCAGIVRDIRTSTLESTTEQYNPILFENYPEVSVAIHE